MQQCHMHITVVCSVPKVRSPSVAMCLTPSPSPTSPCSHRSPLNCCACPWVCLSCSYVVFSFVSHVWVRSYGSQLYWAIIHIRGYVYTPQERLVVGYSHSIVTQPPPQTSIKPQLHLARGRSHRSGDFVSNLPSSSDHLLPQDLPLFTLECLRGSRSSLVGARWPDLNPSFPGAYILYVFLNFTF